MSGHGPTPTLTLTLTTTPRPSPDCWPPSNIILMNICACPLLTCATGTHRCEYTHSCTHSHSYSYSCTLVTVAICQVRCQNRLQPGKHLLFIHFLALFFAFFVSLLFRFSFVFSVLFFGATRHAATIFTICGARASEEKSNK